MAHIALPTTEPQYARGYVETQGGLLVPPNYAGHDNRIGSLDEGPGPVLQGLLQRYNLRYGDGPQLDSFQQGYRVDRNDSWGFIQFPAKTSVEADKLSEALVSGQIANIGISPVVSAQLSAIVQRQVTQARAAEVTLSGRTSPVGKARDAISWYNDSVYGYNEAIAQIVYQYRVFNRGCPHATVPITFPISQWATYGMEAIQIEGSGQHGEPKLYYLEVDWAVMKAPVPFLPNPFDLVATGNSEWPYWYRFRPNDKNASGTNVGSGPDASTNSGEEDSWILLHQSQIVPMLPGKSWTPGIGTCSAYMFWDILADFALEKIRRAEKGMHQPTHGLLTVGGVTQNSEEISKYIRGEAAARTAQGRKVDKGLTVITGREAVNAALLTFRESFADYRDFKETVEDFIATCFSEPLSAIATRAGVGYSAQSASNVEMNVEAGVTGILLETSMILGAFYPRVKIHITRPADLFKQRTLEDFKTFADAARSLPEGVLTVAETRALLHQMIVEIPEVESVVGANPNEDQRDDGTTEDSGADEPTGEGAESTTPVENGSLATIEKDLYQILELARKLEPIKPKGANKAIAGRKPRAERAADGKTLYRNWDRTFPNLKGMLLAVAKEDVADGDTPAWLWDGEYDVLEYQRREAGNSNGADELVVDREEALALRDDFRELRESMSSELAADLAAGRITIQQWLAAIEDAVEEAYVTEHLLGRGGVDQVEMENYDWLDDTLDEPFKTLEDLAKRIAEGTYSEVQIASMTASTIYACAEGYEAGNVAAHGSAVSDFEEFPAGLGLDCHGRCHCHIQFETSRSGRRTWSWVHNPPTRRKITKYDPCDSCLDRILRYTNVPVQTSSKPLDNMHMLNILNRSKEARKDNVEGLSEASLRVLELSREGYNARQIASRVHVTVQTARNMQSALRQRQLLPPVPKR